MRPIGPASPMRGRAAAADLLGRRQIGQIGPMALAGVHRQQTGGAPGRQQPTVRLDGPAQLRDVVAEHFAEAAGLEEIALHVDDQQRARIRLGRKVHRPTHERRRCFLRLQGGDDRPDRAGPNSAFDIFGPRLTACHHYRRKEHACRLDAHGRYKGAATTSFGEGSASPTIGGAAAAVASMTRLVEARRRIVRQGHDFLDRMKCRRNWRPGDFRADRFPLYPRMLGHGCSSCGYCC
jgi:hypothetical protein